MQTIVEFPANISRRDIEGFIKLKKTITFEFQQTDNLHHKYLVSSAYPDDFVMIGIYIGTVKK